MAWAPFTAEALGALASQLADQARVLAEESERLGKAGPDAYLTVNYKLTEDSPLRRGMNTITQFVGAIVAASGHAEVARLAKAQESIEFSPPRKQRRS